MTWYRLILWMPLLLLCACGTELSGGPLLTRVIEPEEVRVLPGEGQFAQVQEIVQSEDMVWVLDGAPPYGAGVTLLDGESVRFGREGPGPGELLGPSSIQPVPGPDADAVRIWDFGNGRVLTFDRFGSVTSTMPLEQDGWPRVRSDFRKVFFVHPLRIRNHEDGLLTGRFPRRIDHLSDYASGGISHVTERLLPVKSLTDFKDHLSKSAVSVSEWEEVPLWDACDGTVVLWSPDRRSVLWLDSTGSVRDATPLAEEEQELSLQEIEGFLTWMGRLDLGPDFERAGVDFARMASRYRDRFPRYRPVITDIRCESKARAWVQLFDARLDPLGRGDLWLQISPSGPERKVQFPHDFVPFVFSPNRVIGVLETPEGAQKLAQVGIESGSISSTRLETFN